MKFIFIYLHIYSENYTLHTHFTLLYYTFLLSFRSCNTLVIFCIIVCTCSNTPAVLQRPGCRQLRYGVSIAAFCAAVFRR